MSNIFVDSVHMQLTSGVFWAVSVSVLGRQQLPGWLLASPRVWYQLGCSWPVAQARLTCPLLLVDTVPATVEKKCFFKVENEASYTTLKSFGNITFF